MQKKLTFSIDRLTIIGTFSDNSSFFRAYDFLKDLPDELCSEITNNDKSLFEFSYYLSSLGFIQIDHPTNKMRIDFNPNKISLLGKSHLNKLLSYLKSIHYSRLDLAIDLYNYNISSYNILDIGNRKSAYFYDKQGRVETIYSGSSKSNKYIRIYNKGVEQKLNNVDWWRFEVQLRDVYIDKYLSEITNFYNDILIYKYNIVDEYTFEENAIIEYLLHDINRLNLLSKNSRTKYKKIIRDLKLSSLDFFDSILNLASDKVLDYLNYISSYKLYPDRTSF